MAVVALALKRPNPTLKPHSPKSDPQPAPDSAQIHCKATSRPFQTRSSSQRAGDARGVAGGDGSPKMTDVYSNVL